MSVVWSRRALRDFDELAAYIAGDSEKSASLEEARIRREAELLADFPFWVVADGFRELGNG